MGKGDWSWVVLLLAVGVVPGVHRVSEAKAAPPAARQIGKPLAASGLAPPATAPPASEEAKRSPAEVELLELFGGFDGDLVKSGPSAGELADRYRTSKRGKIVSLVATVPDPDSSSQDAYYDQALDAIQRAAATEGYLPDRFVLPWRGHGDGSAPAPIVEPAPATQRPGILLFRRVRPSAPDAPPTADLLVVFLVGELPKRGLHHQAFAAAIDLACALRTSPSEPLYVLGPYFSGTAFSLRVALHEHLGRHAAAAPAVTVVSGSAVDQNNRTTIAFGTPGEAASATFEATVTPSNQLQAAVINAITSRLPSRPSTPPVAMLIETGTQWAATLSGQAEKKRDEAFRQSERAPDKAGDATVRLAPPAFRFPLHVAQLRAQREKSRHDSNADPILPLRDRLELRLDRDRESADDLPANSSLAPYEIETMLHEQLIEIARQRFGFLGVVASDPMDLVFIVQEARKFCPGAQLFTLGSHTLFGHPDLMRYLNGLLVVSSYSLAALSTKHGQTFASYGSEGIFNALLVLLARMQANQEDHRPRYRDWNSPFAPDSRGPQIWLSMVSNGALWPFHVEAPDKAPLAQPSVLVPEAAAAGPPRNPPELVGDLAIGLYWLLLAFAVVHTLLLWRYYRKGRTPTDRAEANAELVYVVVMCGAVMFTCAFWAVVAWTVDLGPRAWQSTGAFVAGMLACAAVATVLFRAVTIWRKAPSVPQGPGWRNWARRHSALPVLGATAAVALLWGWPFVHELAAVRWAPTPDLRLALARMVQPLSGASPAVPLFYAAVGLYAWGLVGLTRVRARSCMPENMPFPTESGLWSRKLSQLATDVGSGRTDWIVRGEAIALGLVFVPCLSFWHELLPTFESRRFDPLFKAAFLLLVTAVVASAGQLVADWLQLRRLLRRIIGHPMVDAYDRAGSDRSPWLRLDVEPEVPTPAEIESALQAAALADTLCPGQTWHAQAQTEAATLAGLHGEGAGKTAQEALFRFSRLLFTVLECLWRTGRVASVGKDERPTPLEEMTGDERLIATAEVIVARRVMTLLRYALGRLRGLMTFVSVGAILLVFTVQSYPFHPVRFSSVLVWSIALGGMGTILYVLLGVELDSVLSRMARTRPGHVNLNAAFVGKVLMYGVVPAVVLLASAFPEVGDLLFSWLGPLLRAFHH